MTMPVTRKAMAYITHGTRLLVFRQPDFPEAGVQIPGGSMADDERPEEAVMREAFEETGLEGLALVAFLGDVLHYPRWRPRGHAQPDAHHRHYFHLRVEGDPPETWRHWELDPSEGEFDSVLFEFFWADLPDGVPPLIGDRDQMLPRLIESLGLRAGTRR